MISIPPRNPCKDVIPCKDKYYFPISHLSSCSPFFCPLLPPPSFNFLSHPPITCPYFSSLPPILLPLFSVHLSPFTFLLPPSTFLLPPSTFLPPSSLLPPSFLPSSFLLPSTSTDGRRAPDGPIRVPSGAFWAFFAPDGTLFVPPGAVCRGGDAYLTRRRRPMWRMVRRVMPLSSQRRSMVV